jgi:hypothetical protein
MSIPYWGISQIEIERFPQIVQILTEDYSANWGLPPWGGIPGSKTIDPGRFSSKLFNQELE